MARTVPDSKRADETVTVRVPVGTAAKVRAATGQPFSTVVRWMVVQLLERHANAANLKESVRQQVQASTADSLDDGQPA